MKDPLELLLSDGVIDEVLGRLKSGKEADVFLVQRGADVIAAKVYKDRGQRSFKNNSAYKEGRLVHNSRTQRAIDKGSRFGQREAEDAWKSAESNALYRLHAQGVRVPTPVMFYEGVLLMQLVTDTQGLPAPRLIDAAIAVEDASALYLELRKQLIGMLCCELIHGDLSPYNVLLGAAGPTIIDFPQIISVSQNSQSEAFFRRDFENIHQFFAGIDRRLSTLADDGREIWRTYVRRELTTDFVPRVRTREEYRPVQRAQASHQGGSQGPRHEGRQHAQGPQRGPAGTNGAAQGSRHDGRQGPQGPQRTPAGNQGSAQGPRHDGRAPAPRGTRHEARPATAQGPRHDARPPANGGSHGPRHEPQRGGPHAKPKGGPALSPQGSRGPALRELRPENGPAPAQFRTPPRSKPAPVVMYVNRGRAAGGAPAGSSPAGKAGSPQGGSAREESSAQPHRRRPRRH